MISIPIEIARKLEIHSNTSFVTQLIDGMIIYKPIDTSKFKTYSKKY